MTSMLQPGIALSYLGISWSSEHQGISAAASYQYPLLVEGSVLERHDAGVRAGLGGSRSDHLRLGSQRVAVKHGRREVDILEPQVRDRGSKRETVNRHADQQAEGKEAIHYPRAKFRPGGELLVEMERLRIHRQTAEKDVVRLGDGTGDCVLHSQSRQEILKPASLSNPNW
jgi:hypothetical protein